jgi:glycosyltransferase involved in cell wall biosynthesis
MILWYKLPIKKSIIVITISETVKESLVKLGLCNSNKIKIIPCSANEKLKSYKKTGDKNFPKNYILQIGLAHNKNINRLIDAVKNIENINLILVGDPSDELIIKCKESDKLILIDRALSEAELSEFYNNAKCVTVVSTSEGFGMVILEAQMLGIPVIVSDIEPMKSVAGKAAIFINPFSVESIIKGILLVDKVGDNIIEEGYKNYLRFNLKNNAILHETIYKKILDELNVK